jgi:hypothetical protein
MTRALNLATGAAREYTCPPRRAVLAAHAQDGGDWNTWGYERRYGPLVRHGVRCVTVGDWTALVSVPAARRRRDPMSH